MPADVRTLAAKIKALHPSLRDPTADELTLCTEAQKAGASINPKLLREYLEGADVCPYQFESCHHWSEEYPYEREAVELARESRDRFVQRVRSGDLQPLVLRIGAARAVARVAA